MGEKRYNMQQYAMIFGTYMGVFWILKFTLVPLGMTSPFLLLLFICLTLCVPFMGYYYTKIYRDKVKFYCPNFLCTAGGGQVALRTSGLSKEYAVRPVEVASTIGAGDNFNAGILYGLLKYDVRYDGLNSLGEAVWDKIVSLGMEFSAEACKGFANSVSPEFAEKYRL